MLSFPDPAISDGCYHRRGGPGAWYASDQEQAAWAELFRHFLDDGIDPFEVRRRVGKITCDSLAVLDLTDQHVCNELDVTAADLTGDDYRRTQAIGEAAARAGFDAILAPSAALPGRTTLVVFTAGMDHLTANPSRIRQPPPRLANLLRHVTPHPHVPSAVVARFRSIARQGAETIRHRRRGP